MDESQDASLGSTLPTNSVRIPIPRQHSLFDSLFGAPADKDAPEVKTPHDGGNPVKELTNQLNIQHNFKELKDQFISLQAMVSEHNIQQNFKELRDQFQSLQAMVIEQNGKVALLQKEVSEMAMAMADRDAVASKSEVAIISQDRCWSDIVATTPVLPLQDGDGQRTAPQSPHSQSSKSLRQVAPNLLASLKDVPALTRCQRQGSSQSLKSWLSSNSSRSASPEKIQVEFKNTKESPSRRPISPDSPTSRLEARLAPKLLSNLNNFVDSQMQNLELRVLSVEKICSSWRQAVVLDGVVDGISSADLHMLSGLAVADRSDKQSDSCVGSVSGIPSISADSASTTEPSQTSPSSNPRAVSRAKFSYKKPPSLTKSKSWSPYDSLHAPWLAPRRSVRLSTSQNGSSQEATSSWKRFFGRTKARL